MTLHPDIAAVTDRVIERSRAGRDAYLDLIARERETGIDRRAMLQCAHALQLIRQPTGGVHDVRQPARAHQNERPIRRADVLDEGVMNEAITFAQQRDKGLAPPGGALECQRLGRHQIGICRIPFVRGHAFQELLQFDGFVFRAEVVDDMREMNVFNTEQRTPEEGQAGIRFQRRTASGEVWLQFPLATLRHAWPRRTLEKDRMGHVLSL